MTRIIHGSGVTRYSSITPAEKRSHYPLSSAQRRLFLIDRFEEVGTGYNMSGALIIEGETEPGRLERTIDALIHRHESLRTSFHLMDDQPVQIIHETVDFQIQPLGIEPDFSRLIQRFIRPFHLSEAPLLRVGVTEIETAKQLLIFDLHHIIGDGTSMSILTDDFIRIFQSGEYNLTPLELQYRDFSMWQEKRLQDGSIKEQEEYWLNIYPDAHDIPVMNLPTDYPRPPFFSFKGAHHRFHIHEKLSQRLRKLSSQTGATLYMTLVTAFNILLHKYSGQQEIILGIGIMGRNHADLKSIIGMFVNTLAMRTNPQPDKTLKQLLGEVKEHSINAFDNQDLQFEDLVEKINPHRDSSRNPIFDVSFVFQNFETTTRQLTDIKITPLTAENTTAKLDLTLFSRETGGTVACDFEYCTSLFKADSIQRMAHHFINVLDRMTQNPNLTLSQPDILTRKNGIY